jgi:hypothetical protein
LAQGTPFDFSAKLFIVCGGAMVSSQIVDGLFGLLGRAFVKPIVVVVIGLSLLFEGYHLFGPAEDSLGFMRRSLVDRVCTKVVDDLPRKNGVASVAVLDFAGDVQGFISNHLRERIAAAGEFKVLDEIFFRKLLREFGKDQGPITRLADAVEAARAIGVDLVVFGEIPEFAARQEAAALSMEVRVAERASGQAVFAQSYRERLGDTWLGSAYWRARIADSSKGRRIFIWVAFTLLLPLLTIPLIRRLVAVDSNMVNLAWLLGYTIVDVLFALLLTGFWIATVWTAVVLILALAGSAYYNYSIAVFVERLDH